MPFEYDAVERFLYYLDFKEFDLVIGDRRLPKSSYFMKVPLLRRLGSRVMSFIVGRFVSSGFFDTQCGIKGFRGPVAEDLFRHSYINGFAFDVELLYVALKRNYDIKRLPVVLRCNDSHSVNLLTHGTRMVLDIFYIKFLSMSGNYAL